MKIPQALLIVPFLSLSAYANSLAPCAEDIARREGQTITDPGQIKCLNADAAFASALKRLCDDQGKAGERFLAYADYRKGYLEIRQQLKTETNESRRRILQAKAQIALEKWQTLGYKLEVESALADFKSPLLGDCHIAKP